MNKTMQAQTSERGDGHVSTASSPGMTRGLTLIMAIGAGASVANIYYCQPLVGLMVRDFGAASGVSFVPAATQLGYALGLVLLVPLGDTVDRRRLILWQSLGLVVALALAALAPTAAMLLLASVAVGVAATIAQQIIPFAVDLAPVASRGRVVGTVMSGLLTGIVLARTVSGEVAAFADWRAMFWLGAFVAIVFGALFAVTLPRRQPATTLSYPHLLRSLAGLIRAHPALRRSVMIQGALFAGFSAFWTTLALLLAGPRFHLGSDIAGLFGIVGLAGVLLAPLAGRRADTAGPHGIIGVGIVLVAVAFATFAASPTLLALCIGVVVLDAGVQMSMVSNQAVIFALDPPARSRVNTVFMTGLFLAGAAGSAIGSVAWHAGGWHAVTAFGGLLALAAFAVHVAGRRAQSAIRAV